MDKIHILRAKGYTYLGHVTKSCNVKQLYDLFLKNPDQKIGTLYERYVERIQVEGVYSNTTLDLDMPHFEIPNPADYPGLFFHLCHQSIEELRERYSKSSCVIMLFPLELLLQRNWHFKIVDKNGMIDYDSYFPENMETIPSYDEVRSYYESIQGYYIGNEIVFHDGIPLCNCIEVCGKNIDFQIPYQLKLDLERAPNYIFYSDRRYDGTKVPYYHIDHRSEYTTSDEFYIHFIRKHIPEKYKYLCENVSTKEELETRIFETKVDHMDLFTYLYIYRSIC